MRDLGLADSNLNRTEKRQLRRQLSEARTLAEIRARIQHLSAESIIRQVASLDGNPPYIVSRVVHEAALVNGDTEATAGQVRALANDLHNVADPDALARVGIDFSDHVTQRFLASQLIGQAPPLADIHRILAVLAPDIEAGVLGRAAWRELLNMELTDLIVGVLGISGLVGTLGAIQTAPLAQLPNSIGRIVASTLDLLAASLEGIRQVVDADEKRLGADVIRGLGPLASFPIIRLQDGRLVVPSRAHLDATLGMAGLYIRLVRADAVAKTRERTDAAGSRFDGYLQRIAAESLPHGWVVIDLDEDAEPEESRADFLIIPPDGSFVLVVESKTTLQALTSQLRPWDDKKLVGDLYQGAFDQIDASARRLARDDVPVFGLVVTLDRHITTRLDERTYVGVPIITAAPTSPSAASQTPIRVVSAQDFEDLIEVLASVLADRFAYLAAIYADGSSMNATERIRAGLPDEVKADNSLSDRLRVEALTRLASSAGDPAIRAVFDRARR